MRKHRWYDSVSSLYHHRRRRQQTRSRNTPTHSSSWLQFVPGTGGSLKIQQKFYIVCFIWPVLLLLLSLSLLFSTGRSTARARHRRGLFVFVRPTRRFSAAKNTERYIFKQQIAIARAYPARCRRRDVTTIVAAGWVFGYYFYFSSSVFFCFKNTKRLLQGYVLFSRIFTVGTYIQYNITWYTTIMRTYYTVWTVIKYYNYYTGAPPCAADERM